MSRVIGHIAFDACHACVPAVLFAAILLLTMFSVQPVLVALSLTGALAFSALARGPRATLLGLRWQLPMLALVCLANPLFSASGSTLLVRLGPVCVYAESLAYGAVMGALMVSVVVWFEGAAAVLTQDRLLSLGRGARPRSRSWYRWPRSSRPSCCAEAAALRRRFPRAAPPARGPACVSA